jgi:hypothetical protein
MVRKSSNINALRSTVLDLATCWQRTNFARCSRQRQAALSPRRAVGSQLGCCTARLGCARVIEII